MKVKILIFIIFGFSTINGFSQAIDIGLFQHLKSTKLFIEAGAGKYKVKAGKKTLYRLKNDRAIIFNYTKGYINVSNSKKDFGLYKEIEIVSKKYRYNKVHNSINSKKNSELNVKLINPKKDSRTYQGNLKLYVKDKSLEIVNQLAMPDYLAGVVEAESGPNEVEEYYKNQAVICRTYAMATLDKHKTEGFNLCDGVHCQAYKGKSTQNQLIQKAVKETKDLVIVDENDQLISALFSANCGGQTNNSEDVWSTALPYLRSIKDEYCTDQRQATWTKTVDFSDWKNFLKEKLINFEDTLSIDSFAFDQPVRLKNYMVNNQGISLTALRYGLKLRSTFFSVKPNEEQLILQGKGYGHGVGMCQEGAMNMARKGRKFDEIIKYYYTGVKIKPFSQLHRTNLKNNKT